MLELPLAPWGRERWGVRGCCAHKSRALLRLAAESRGADGAGTRGVALAGLQPDDAVLVVTLVGRQDRLHGLARLPPVRQRLAVMHDAVDEVLALADEVLRPLRRFSPPWVVFIQHLHVHRTVM